MNFSNSNAKFNLSKSIGAVNEILINNLHDYELKNGKFNLKPWQAIIVRIT